MSIDQLMTEALALPDNLKIQLVEELLASLETVDGAIQAEWIAEAQRRRDEILAGTVQTIPGDEALAQARNLLNQ
ncbi:addiction module protein [Leptolyngbya sp. KIOST-1]|uniref:addiction module protein n=1 Tax=Leptolyngbya sp. KIOST-1 TaxID=1229172 RepID=UPI000566A2B6|nr:addiction module protein [Leptolyngbya sp. KIOST-1]